MEILSLGIEFVVQTGFLTLALWVLVKLQKLQFTFAGLLGSAALASLLDLIPFVGHYLAVTVLFVCIWKVTREDRGTVCFTVGVSYALTFGMNLWLFSAMIGDLTVAARSADPMPPLADNGSAAVTEDSDTEFADIDLAEAPQPAAAQEKAAPAKEPVAPAPVPVQSSPPKVLGLALKGIIKGPVPTVMLAAGSKTYSLFPGDSVKVETRTGKYEVSLEKVKDNSVVLNVGGQQMELSR